MFGKQAAQRGIFGGMTFFGFRNGHDVELPAGEVGGQADVLSAPADGQCQLVFGNDDIDCMMILINHNAADFCRRQCVDDELRRIR